MPQFLLFYPNFGPLLHLQYMKTHIEAFPQSCRWGEYLSFAILVNPITVLENEQLAFPCKKNRQTLAEEVMSMSRNQN